MLCKCGAIPERNTGRCPDCRRQQQAEYMRRQREEARHNSGNYDLADHAGKRARLVELARKAGLVR